MSTHTKHEPGVVTFVEGHAAKPADPKVIAQEAARLVADTHATGKPMSFTEAVAQVTAGAQAKTPEAIAGRARKLAADAHAIGKPMNFTEAVHLASIES